MAKVTLSYDGLKTQAKAIENQKTQFDELIRKVMTTMQQLNDVWDDEAARDFTTRVKNMQPTFNKFGEALKGLSEHMTQVSNKYEELSRAVKSSQNNF
jgi:WXG100 family type VII secretion target